MHNFAISSTIAGVLALGTLALAGTAAAAPTGGSNAADAVKALQDMGYSVQLNGSLTGSLPQCTVTGVHGLSDTDTGATVGSGTVYVDVSCPSLND
jgi:hypothetical protein